MENPMELCKRPHRYYWEPDSWQLRQKEVERSSKMSQWQREEPETHWWIAKHPTETIRQSEANKFFWRNPKWEKHCKTLEQINAQPFCTCSKSLIDDFSRNSKLTKEQKVYLINEIQIGTSLEVFRAVGTKIRWFAWEIQSKEWGNHRWLMEFWGESFFLNIFPW